ncbi:MAG: aldehyde dehydrogenase family protein [Chloroflexi bacterium]|nr:aldehyde dehydrogenase family protein [Chloroflexota bacterium]MCI0576717.1 aldehyde dehydrogenase family protein [Chloroflexota bacterium]MCI0649414.1 aldehyde dehydrogenase family protein [Chloroflexota bacterium]MCI0730786.1 aldehyde dehydrogenase family protein [Chloroflexota bacterium]
MKPMYINGRWLESDSGVTLSVLDPAREEVLENVPAGDAADAAKAVAAASAAFDQWRWTPGLERAEMLHEAARKIRDHFDDVARLLTLEEGKAISENEEEVEWVIGTLDYYAEMARTYRGRLLAPADRSQFNFVLKEPYGVVGCIVPFNYPLLLMIWKVAPALAAGNTVVVKPAVQTPLSTLLLAEIAFDHLPAGVFNVVTGGATAGEALVIHPDVPVIAFTGSVAVGQRIARLAADRIKRTHLELGGKDAFVVAPDADIETAVEAVAYAALINTGQVCTSTERVYVPDHHLPAFAGAMADYVRGLRLGPGLERTTDIGPMADPKYRARVEEHVADAIHNGAKVLAGGHRPAQFERGFYYEPTVLVNVNHTMRCMREETFGPTIPLMGYHDFDEAIRLVNDSDYGLGACLRTDDAHLAKRFFEEVRAGTIWINDPLTDNYGGPFGGMKLSGNARELGQEGLESFLETKHVHWDFSDQPKEWWYPYGREA